MVRESARPGWFDSAADLDQFGTRTELGTDGLVKLVRALGLRVAPGKVTADLGIVATVVDDADVVAQKGTAPAAHPGAPFAPASLVHICVPKIRQHGPCFGIGHGRAPAAAVGRVRAGIARERRKLLHREGPATSGTMTPSTGSVGDTPMSRPRVGPMLVVLSGLP